MITNFTTVRAHPNIAFIKYWGNKDSMLRIPVNSSLSMNLEELYTETSLVWDSTLESDVLELNGQLQTGETLARVQRHLEQIRLHIGLHEYAYVKSFNNFPMGAGIASSASSFAALTLAAVKAADAQVSEKQITSLARLGSGSASRSIPTGFVEWHEGYDHETSYAESFAPPNYWDLVDVVAVVSGVHKTIGSTEGHQTASTSDLQSARVSGAAERLTICKQAIIERNFETFAEVVELDSNLMHAVMMTSRPPLFYWMPSSIEIMRSVQAWRNEGLQVCYTLDAGPNVHCICVRKDVDAVSTRLKSISGVVDTRIAGVGGAAHQVKNV